MLNTRIQKNICFLSKQKEIEKPGLGFVSLNLPCVQHKCLQHSKTFRSSVFGRFYDSSHCTLDAYNRPSAVCHVNVYSFL